MNTPSIYGLTLDQLEAWLLEQGQKKFRLQSANTVVFQYNNSDALFQVFQKET